MHLVPQTDVSDLNAALRLISHRAQMLTRGTAVAIALAHRGSMVCRASVGANAPSLGCRLDVTSGFSGECVRTGKALRCDDSEADPRVDVASCRRLGIRSILAAPILLEREVVGLLEVFSAQRFAFDDGDLAAVKRLAQTVFLTPPALNITSAPKLLVEMEPAHRVFFRNLMDVLLSPQMPPVKLTPPPAQFWPDVFVPSRLPWERFVQSIVLHVIMIAALGSFLEFGVSQQQATHYRAFDKSHVVYYLPSEYLPRAERGRVLSRSPRERRTELVKQPVISVPRERDSRTQAIITPPDIKLKHAVRLLHIMAWNSVAPAVPLSATTRTQLITPTSLVAVIAPPPDVSAVSRSRALTAPPPAVIEPPPSVYRSIRQIGDIDIGRFEIVTPAPQMPMHEQDSIFATARATLRGAITSVVPPPPSVNDLKNTGWQHTSTLSAAAMQVVPPPPLLPTGNSTRGTQDSTAIPVVPPPPSVDGLKNTGGQYMSTLSAAAMPVVPPRTAIPRAADNATSRGPIELSTPLPGVQSPREAIGDGRGTLADTKELSVSFIGPVLPLPSSSYFSSREVFIAEERLSRHQSRLIKLIYDFLPYQPRLSDYGPNYPAVDKLRATRDPTCDETLMQVTSSVSTPGWSPADRQLDSKYLDQRQSKLACFRTTADDYRRARARQHK